jgi:hypothetical protein
MQPFATPPLRAPMPLNRLDEEFFAHCAKERLCFQRCTACGSWRHLPRAWCARCGSDAWEWQPSCGRARLYSWTITHQAILPGFADHVPFVVAVVELEEGVRMVSALRGVARDDLRIDLPLQVAFERVPDGAALPVFVPRGT